MKRVLLLMLVLTVAVALPACGGGEEESAAPETVEGTVTGDTGDGGAGAEGDVDNGRSIYASAGCGGCHTLSDAGSSGTIGPDLDDAQPSQEAVAQKVRVGGGGMPAFEGRLSDQEIQDVAAYVSSVAGG